MAVLAGYAVRTLGIGHVTLGLTGAQSTRFCAQAGNGSTIGHGGRYGTPGELYGHSTEGSEYVWSEE